MCRVLMPFVGVVPTPESAPRVPARDKRRLCTRMPIEVRVHVRQNGRPNVPYGKQITLYLPNKTFLNKTPF